MRHKLELGVLLDIEEWAKHLVHGKICTWRMDRYGRVR